MESFVCFTSQDLPEVVGSVLEELRRNSILGSWSRRLIEAITAFLAANKAVIGAVVSILEGIIVLINLWKKFKAKSKARTMGKRGEVTSMVASPSLVKAFIGIINPVNVFRK